MWGTRPFKNEFGPAGLPADAVQSAATGVSVPKKIDRVKLKVEGGFLTLP